MFPGAVTFKIMSSLKLKKKIACQFDVAVNALIPWLCTMTFGLSKGCNKLHFLGTAGVCQCVGVRSYAKYGMLQCKLLVSRRLQQVCENNDWTHSRLSNASEYINE